jgi:hypothetical protein
MSISRRAIALAAVAAAGLAGAGCSLADDGPQVTQTRDVASFSSIDNRSSVDVHLHVGPPQRVRVRAGEKVVGEVHTDVRDGTLRLTFDHHGIGGGDVVVDAWVPRLTGVAVTGSGDVTGAGIDADALEVRSDGSGDVALHGTARRLSVGLDGSGDADLGALDARVARVSVGGSGDVEVRADERLAAEVDGSGDVHYHGEPAVTKRVDGSGDVARAG